MENWTWSGLLEMLRIYALQAGVVTLKILLLVLLGLAAARLLRVAFGRLQQKMEQSRHGREVSPDLPKRVATLIGLLRTGCLVALWVVLAIMVLSQLGLDIGPILAGAGILGLAVGFGAQNLVRDIISGFFFILEDTIRVGDVAVVNGTSGVVEHISFRTVHLRDFAGTLHVFAHGQVNTLANMTKDWAAALVDVGVAYQTDLRQALDIMKQTAEQMRADPGWKDRLPYPPEILGVELFSDSAIVLRLRLKTRAGDQWAAGREYRLRLQEAFARAGIEIPFPQRVLHAGRGFASPEPLKKTV